MTKEMVSPTSVELGVGSTEVELLVEDSSCTELCEGTTVTNGLDDGLDDGLEDGLDDGFDDGLDTDVDDTGDGETEEDIRMILTDEEDVLLA